MASITIDIKGGGPTPNPNPQTVADRDAEAAGKARLRNEVMEGRRQKKFEDDLKWEELEALKRQAKQEAADEIILARIEQAAKKKLEAMAKQERKQAEADELILIRIEKQAEKKLEAMRKSKEKEEEAAEKEKKAVSDRRAAAVGGAAAALIRGGGVGATLGGGLGSAIGSRAGPGGAAVAGAIGEKVGGAADNLLPNAASFSAKVAGGKGAEVAVSGINAAATGAAVALSAIPGAGLPAAMAIKAFGSTVTTATAVMDAFATRGKELKGYSGQIATASAQQDVARLMSDIRESRRLGDGYANVIKSQTQFEETLKAGLIPIKEWILGVLPKYMGWILDAIIKGLEIMEAIYKEFDSDGSVLGRMAEDMKRARAALEKSDVDADKLIDRWLGPELPSMNLPAPDAVDSALGVPLFAAM